MSRKTARENAFRLVYEFCVNGEGNGFTEELLCENCPKDDSDFTKSVYIGVQQRYDFLSDVITRFSNDFAFNRIYKVDLAIMLISSYEILFRPDIPLEVSVNEAVELAKVYSTEKSATFINGVLASVFKSKEELLFEYEQREITKQNEIAMQNLNEEQRENIETNEIAEQSEIEEQGEQNEQC